MTEEEKEIIVYINSEIIAFQIAGIVSKDHDRYFSTSHVYHAVKSLVNNQDLIDDIYNDTISLLENKYKLDDIQTICI